MKKNRLKFLLTFLLSFLIVANFLVLTSFAKDEFPERPITIIVPFGAGGTSDLMVRSLQEAWGEKLGVKIIINNKTGAGGQVAWEYFLRVKQDGYTIVTVAQPHFSGCLITQKPSFSMDDFYVFAIHDLDPPIINVLKSSPWNNVIDMVEAIKANPGKYAFGATQNSGPALLGGILKEKLGLDLNFVPYKGGTFGRAALLGGHIDIYFGDCFSQYQIYDQVKGLGIVSDEPMELWPGVGSVNEELETKYGITLPYLPMFRGFAVSQDFKNKYPERFDLILKAYKDAFKDAKHIEVIEKINATAVLVDFTGEIANKKFKDYYETIRQYGDFYVQ